MNTNKLFLFSKNTDAFAAQRGYNYQTLKTLETWVSNFLEGKNEDIYCEFEEDIFHKNLLDRQLKFRQIKLYSSGFSFSSDEIKKSLGHFLSLHAKLDYKDFNKVFVFETNTYINKKYKDNDADLLREWFENQDSLEEPKLKRYALKIKDIIKAYLDEKPIGIKDNALAKEAMQQFLHLDESYWKEFVKMIKWKFSAVSADAEFEDVKNRTLGLIQRLPQTSHSPESAQVFSVLLECVFMKVGEKHSEDRKLSAKMLEQAMLNMGSAEDKWYARRFDYYYRIEEIDTFRIGEFYEILDLVNYCRRKDYLHRHKDIWNKLMSYYVTNEEVNDNFRRSAIYELVFLNTEFYEVDYENLGRRERPAGSIVGFEKEIRFYFGDLSAFKNSRDLENARTILGVLVGDKKSTISIDEIRNWFVGIFRKICRKLNNTVDVNEKCYLLEQKGMTLMGINRYRDKDFDQFVRYFDELLVLANDAPLFQLSRFGERIEKYIKMQIHNDPKDVTGITAALEDFSLRLFPLVEKREGRRQLAKSQIGRAYSYLKTQEPKNMLKALDYFHKAKDNYLVEDTIEGYILALLNIAQIYSALGMHFAAKHYGLAGYRMAMNKEQLNRVENSLSILLHADYSAGSWFNALNIYRRYISLRLESNFDRVDSAEEISCTNEAAFALYVMKRSSTQFEYFIKSYFGYLDYVGEEVVVPLTEKIDEELKQHEHFLKAIESQLMDFPLNDIGNERQISFYALGSLWKIKFPNSFDGMAIYEEYVSALQIILAEIALSTIDFHLLQSEIDITLEIDQGYKAPEQKASNLVILWKVYVCQTDTKEIKKMNYHAAFLMVSIRQILNDISLLPDDEFDRLIMSFVRDSKLDSKQLVVNLYQKMHRDVYFKSDFDAFKPNLFNKEDFSWITMPRENAFMVWNDTLSEKYNKEFSLEAIKNRFNNVRNCTYLTLGNLRKDLRFPKWINNLRKSGWKDWQIMSNIQNFMINYKIRVFEDGEFSSDEAFVEHYQKMFYKYTDMDESECYVEFPLEAFMSDEFLEQFNIGLPSTLRTYGLETKQSTPNFIAIKEFLDIRLNLRADDYHENNPLKNISEVDDI